MNDKQYKLGEQAIVMARQGLQTARDSFRWGAAWRLSKFHDGEKTPYETVDILGNLLMYGGVSCLWQCLIGNGTATAGQSLTYFNNAQAAIGVGDSNTAASATQTDLQASSNKTRVAMDATYPLHTDGVVSGSASITWQSTFGTSAANWAWQEVGVFNSATAATGRMLNRLVQSLGTKTSAASWTLQFSASIA